MDAYLLGGICAVAGAAAAACFDLREKKIPNIIPFSMLLLSLPLAFFGGYMIPWALNTLLASVVFYLFWTLRVWAAGDSKLLIGFAALVPSYPAWALLPPPAYGGFFFFSVVGNLLLVYLAYTLVLVFRKSSGKSRFALVFAAIIALSAAAYVLDFAFVIPFLFFFLVLRIYAEAAKLDLTRTVAASDLRVGDNLAERFVEEDGRVIRGREKLASVSSLLGRLMEGDASAPAASGLSCEENERINELVASGRIADGIRVYGGVVMSPMILAAVLFSVAVGDVLSAAF
jgi:Flp pilus assembly protein protease CpaA